MCRSRLGVLAMILLLLTTLTAASSLATPKLGSPAHRSALAEKGAPFNPRPSALCGPNDQPETGLQGEVPLVDMMSLRSQEPYFCGMTIVGHNDILNRGANWNMAWIDHCAYVATTTVPNTPEPAGTAVIDVSDPSSPKLTEILRTPGALNSIEAIHAAQAGKRKVLVAADMLGGEGMDIYDATDCAHPEFMTTYQWAAHNITVGPSTKWVYSASSGAAAVSILDITDMTKPKLIGSFPLWYPDGSTTPCHNVHLNRSETRLYCAGTRSETMGGDPGPSIWDISRVVRGDNDAGIAFVSEPKQGTGPARRGINNAAQAVPATINGKPYLVVSNELGACPGMTPYIYDISNEKKPRVVGEFKLEVNDPANCDETLMLETTIANFSPHYNNVGPDYYKDTWLGIWGYTASGVRVVDLRDPENPMEVAYYNPGANPGTTLPDPFNFAAQANQLVVDACGAYNRYYKKTGHIWFTCAQNGFFVAKLSRQVREYLDLAGPGPR